jgi:hypothetical protein
MGSPRIANLRPLSSRQAGYELHANGRRDTAGGWCEAAGPCSTRSTSQLLSSSELIIGLGDPVIGPTPIEACNGK